jgi:hypothetical protein
MYDIHRNAIYHRSYLESCSSGACKTFPLGSTSRLDLQSLYDTTSVIESHRWVIRCVISSHFGRESGNQRMALTVGMYHTHGIILRFSLLVLCLAALGRGRGTGSRRPAARGVRQLVRHSGQEHRNAECRNTYDTASRKQSSGVPAAAVKGDVYASPPSESVIRNVTIFPAGTSTGHVYAEICAPSSPKSLIGWACAWPAGRRERWYGPTPPCQMIIPVWQVTRPTGVAMEMSTARAVLASDARVTRYLASIVGRV